MRLFIADACPPRGPEINWKFRLNMTGLCNNKMIDNDVKEDGLFIFEYVVSRGASKFHKYFDQNIKKSET